MFLSCSRCPVRTRRCARPPNTPHRAPCEANSSLLRLALSDTARTAAPNTMQAEIMRKFGTRRASIAKGETATLSVNRFLQQVVCTPTKRRRTTRPPTRAMTLEDNANDARNMVSPPTSPTPPASAHCTTQTNACCCILRSRATLSREENSRLGVLYGVLLWAGMGVNAATPPVSRVALPFAQHYPPFHTHAHMRLRVRMRR